MKAYIIFDYDYYIMDKMDSIKVGMNENDVVSILGQPKFIDYDSNITIYFGDKSLYGKVVENPNKAFWYSTGIDYSALYVFDRNNVIVFINVGGT